MNEDSPSESDPLLGAEPRPPGLEKRRSCTDIVCLVFLGIFIFGWIVISGYAYHNGTVGRLIAPIDSNGLICGISKPVRDKKYLFFFQYSNRNKKAAQLETEEDVELIFDNQPQVCVEKCPKHEFNLTAMLRKNSSNFDEIRSKIICIRGFDKSKIVDSHSAKQAVRDKQCVGSYNPSKSYARRCLPFNLKKFKASGIVSTYQTMLADIQDSYPGILLMLFFSAMVCLILIVLMRWFVGRFFWVVIFVSIGVIVFSIIYSAFKFKQTSRKSWLFILIGMVISLIGILITTLCFRKQIRFALGLIEEASKAVSTVMSSVIFPILPMILHLTVFAFLILVGLKLHSIGPAKFNAVGLNHTECICNGPALHYKNDQPCDQDIFAKNCFDQNVIDPITARAACKKASCRYVGIEHPRSNIFLQIYCILAALWTYKFISAYGQMVLASSFATWYWSLHKSDIPFFTIAQGMYTTIRYHLGTLAFGSLILTICSVIKFIIDSISNCLKAEEGANCMAQACMCCLECCFNAIKELLRYITHNAYIMCAIYGKNFCVSAKDAYELLMRSVLRAFAVAFVSKFLFQLMKIMMAVGMGLISYWYFAGSSSASNHVEYKLLPAGLVAIGTFMIASMFFGVYTMAIDTMFICVLEDVERNDGSDEKPYFMSIFMQDLLKENGYTINKQTEI